ncbi:hypothetical protein ACFLR1_00910 [Bacteroidota bacterium]
MGDRIKILFVVSAFYQAGTERFTYEVDRALNKDKFSVDILSLLPLKASKRFDDHYYQKHIDLESKIYFLNDIDILHQPSLKERLLRKLQGKSFLHDHHHLRSFLSQYDTIAIMGIENYPNLARWMTPELKVKCLIHVHTSKHQKEDVYALYDKHAPYHFISGFNKKEIEWELSEFDNYKHTYFGLNFKLNVDFVKETYKTSNKPRIGIFTRITSIKPLDPFIYAFQCVLNEIPGAELHFYGSGDPETEGIMRYVKQLQIQDNVFFRGHQENILETAVTEQLDLVWLHGYHGIPGGYAGFDICTTGIPQIFWNFGDSDTEIRYDCFPVHHNIVGFAQQSVELLNNPNKAKLLAESQRDYVKENLDIDKFIEVLEKAHSDIGEPENSPK